MLPNVCRALVVAGALALSAGPAAAGTQTANVSITANVIQNCSTLSPASGSITFNAYDVFANKTTPDNDNTGATFTINCTRNAANVTFSVSGGSNCTSSPISGDRALKSGTAYLAYQLYEDSAHSIPWTINAGTCAGTTQLSAGSVSSSSQNLTFSLYGQIPAGQDAPVGSAYTDSVRVTVNY